MKNSIWLGDLAIAWASTATGTAVGESLVAAMLGLSDVEHADGSEETEDSDASASLASSVAHAPAFDSAYDTMAESDSMNSLPLLAPVSHEPTAITLNWSVPSLDKPESSASPLKIPHTPLFATGSSTRLTEALMARYTEDGPVDTAATVERLAKLISIQSLPRFSRKSLRFGAQILVDRADSMRPFAHDQDEVVSRARQSLGKNVEILYFRSSPLLGVRKAMGGSERYRAPAPGTPVLVLTDFGAMRQSNCRPGATRREWCEFVRYVRRRECHPIGLVPYPRTRWPQWLGRELPVVAWDRKTTAGAVSVVLR